MFVSRIGESGSRLFILNFTCFFFDYIPLYGKKAAVPDNLPLKSVMEIIRVLIRPRHF
jgi:hypothetical protein